MAIPLLESLRVSAANLCRDRPLLIISHQATLTGAPAVVESLGMHMKMLGCSIIYLVIETGPQIQAYHSIGLVYQLSDFENSPIQAIKHIIERHRPFAVVCNTITTTDYAQLIKTEAPDITCLGWIHEMPTVINSFFGGHQTATRAAAYCDRLIFGSKFVRDRFAHEYAVPPSLLGILPYIRKIPPSSMGLSQHAGLLPQSSADAVEQRHSGKYLIIGCGTAEPRKGLDIFVRVAAIILRESPADIAINISFEWYGCPSYNDNYVDFCKLDAKQLGIEEHIKFMPVSEDFRDRLHEATLFVPVSYTHLTLPTNKEICNTVLPVSLIKRTSRTALHLIH